jgi:hypothetical protein
MGLNVMMLRAALRTRGFWRGAFAVLAAAMAAQIVVWELDLGGWRRDGLLCLPILSGWVLAEVEWRRLRSESGSGFSRDSKIGAKAPPTRERRML